MIFLLQVPNPTYPLPQDIEEAGRAVGVPPAGILEIIVFIFLTLLILSIITERATTFYYISFVKKDKSKSEGPIIRDGGPTPPSAHLEREKKVTLASLIIGVIIAFALKVNILEMMTSSQPTETLFWSNYSKQLSLEGGDAMSIGAKQGWYILKLVIGISVTGFFLSFGSKFFHDLLDLLFVSKNLRRILTDEKQMEMLNKGSNSFIKESQFEALTQIQHKLDEGVIPQLHRQNIVGAHPKINDDGQAVLHLELEDEDIQDIPPEVTLQVRGRSVNVPVEVSRNVKAADPHVGPGQSLLAFPSTSSGRVAPSKGTFTCTFQSPISGEMYALTCAHVVPFEFPPNQNTVKRFIPESERSKYQFKINEDTTAKLVYYQLDQELDLAVLQLEGGTHSNSIQGIGDITSFREIVPIDAVLRTRVTIVNQENKNLTGFVVKVGASQKIGYPNGNLTLRKLMLIQGMRPNRTFGAITQKGDSGAIIVDDKTKKIVGMVIGATSDKNYTLAVPFSRAMQAVSMNLDYNENE
ncbi:MAG: hypothetical protein AAFS00_09435 [Bacteroidota bacterium]